METVKPTFISFLFLISSSCLAREVPFDDVIRNPERYNRQHVTVKGLLETGGDDHELWRDVSALKHQDLEHSIHIWPDLSRPTYPGTNMSPDSPANLHWVKLTGMVNTSIHGRFGSERFGMTLEKIEILPGRRLKEFLNIVIWFKNDSGHTLTADVHSKPVEAVFDISPREVGTTEIEPEQRAVIELTLSKKPFAAWTLVPSASRRFYDADKRAYYFRITDRKISPILPSETRKWKFAPTPERD